MRLRYKKLSIFLLFTVIIIGLFIPLSSANAFLSIILAPFVWMAKMLAKLYMGIWASQYALRMANGILGWVTNPNFIQDMGGYTGNTLVQEGWRIVRDLVNMFFILIVVAIGIGTALRTREYEIKKTIPKLIAIALLINFTPIICGVIIDASNILMNFFLSAGTRGMGTVINQMEAPQNSLRVLLKDLWDAVVVFNISGVGLAMFRAGAVLAFNLGFALVLIALALLFLVRYLFLWMLVILAPLAFFCFILPTTKKIWSIWWGQFIQWCFVGIGAAFFLYLSQRMADIIGTLILEPGAEETQLGTEGLPLMILYLVPVVFLAAGFVVTTKFAPMGAQQLIGLVKRGAKWPMSKKGKEVRQRLKEGVKAKVRGVMPEKVKEAVSRLETYKPGWGQEEAKTRIGRLGRWVQRGAAKEVGELAQTAARPGKVLIGGGIPAEEKDVAETYKEAKANDMWTNTTKFKTDTPGQRVGRLQAMGEKGQIQEALRRKRLHEGDIVRTYKRATEIGIKKTVKELDLAFVHNTKTMERFAKVIDYQTRNLPKEKQTTEGLTQGDIQAGIGSYQEKVWRKLKKEGDFEKLNYEEIKKEPETHAAFMKTALEFDDHQLAQAGKTLGRDFMDEVQTKAHENPDWFFKLNPKTGKMNNPLLPRHFASTTSAYSPLEGLDTRERVAERTREGQGWEIKLASAQGRELTTAQREEGLNKLMTEAQEAQKEDVQEAVQTALRRLQGREEREEPEEEEERPPWLG